jgi:hypothetical protein
MTTPVSIKALRESNEAGFVKSGEVINKLLDVVEAARVFATKRAAELEAWAVANNYAVDPIWLVNDNERALHKALSPFTE